LQVSKFRIKGKDGASVIKMILAPDPDSFVGYLRVNMEAFLKSRKNMREIYHVLKREGVFSGSYYWFAHLFAREKAYYLNDELQKTGKEADPDVENGVSSLTAETIPQGTQIPDGKIGGKVAVVYGEKEIPERFKLKHRADLEVPINEVQESLDAGAMIEDQYESYTGVIFAPGKQDVRRFQKWLPQSVCERFDLPYRSKENVATKSDVLGILDSLDLGSLNNKEGRKNFGKDIHP
jgi:hypothetical protein